MYSDEERHILNVTPGVTDIASIVFYDEERILANTTDPDLGYHQLVRPWKSRFCLLYLKKRSGRLDVEILRYHCACSLFKEAGSPGAPAGAAATWGP